MIFRLGYDPQTIELAAIKVESFGKAIGVGGLPTSMTTDRKRAKALAAAGKQAQASAGPVEAGELTFDIDAGKVIRAISPYVYGINSQKEEGVGRDGQAHGRQPPDRVQLGEQRVQRRQRLQPPERRVAVQRARLQALQRAGRAVRRVRARRTARRASKRWRRCR